MSDLVFPITDAAWQDLADAIHAATGRLAQARSNRDEALEVLLSYTALSDNLDDQTAELARLLAHAERRLAALIALDHAIRDFRDASRESSTATQMRYAIAVIEAHLTVQAIGE